MVATEQDTARLLAEMQTMLANQAAEIAALRAAQTDGDTGLDAAIREFASQYESHVPGQKMVGPCIRLNAQGVECRRPWADHVGQDAHPARVTGHSYLEAPVAVAEVRKRPGEYARDDVALTVEAVAAEPLEQTYVTEKQAAERLGVPVAGIRKMVKAGTVKADRVGAVTLIRRQSVERVAVLAEYAAAEEVSDG